MLVTVQIKEEEGKMGACGVPDRDLIGVDSMCKGSHLIDLSTPQNYAPTTVLWSASVSSDLSSHYLPLCQMHGAVETEDARPERPNGRWFLGHDQEECNATQKVSRSSSDQIG